MYEVIDISHDNLDSACASSKPAFGMMYSSYKLIKQGDILSHIVTAFTDLEPVCCSKSGCNCWLLTSIQISQEAGEEVWYSHFVKNFPVCCDRHSQGL